MWHLPRLQHQALLAFFIPFIRLAVAVFCPRENRFHEVCSAKNFETSIVVRETCLPHDLNKEDQIAFEEVATILRNPYTKLSLPPQMWMISMNHCHDPSPLLPLFTSLPPFLVQNPAAAASALHWTDEVSTYEGDRNQQMLFHGAGVWTYERWQYAGRWENGFPQGLGTITEKDPITGTNCKQYGRTYKSCFMFLHRGAAECVRRGSIGRL